MTQITLEISTDLERALSDLAAEQNKSVEAFALEQLNSLVEQQGSPAAILRGLRELPPIDPADIEELKRAIKVSRIPAADGNIFS